jgi:hypothetical protein
MLPFLDNTKIKKMIKLQNYFNNVLLLKGQSMHNTYVFNSRFLKLLLKDKTSKVSLANH